MSRRYLSIGLGAMLIALAGCSQASSVFTTIPTVQSPTAQPSEAPSEAANPATLTEAEITALTGGVRLPIPAAAPAPAISAAEAEATVRAKYPGQRGTIGVVRIAMNLPGRVLIGWFVALTPADGETCNLHPGLLPRAIEGGVVDDQAGDVDWDFVCGP